MSNSSQDEKNNTSPHIAEAKSTSNPGHKLNISRSENCLERQKKQVNKVRSWSGKEDSDEPDSVNVELDLAASFSKLDVVESGEEIQDCNLAKARDSLDNLPKDEQNMPKISLAKSLRHSRARNTPDSPKSSPALGENLRASTSWDPYDKHGRKNRKELKNKNKATKKSEGEAVVDNNKSSTKGDDSCDKIEDNSNNEGNSVVEGEEVYRYKYFPKNSKSVVFTNEVLVVYFNNEDVVGEFKEPLKKEIEQQTRNKQMRRCHLIKTQEKYNLCLF